MSIPDSTASKENVNIDMKELQLLTINETCELLRIGRSFAYDLIRSGKLRTLKFGAKRLVQPSAVRELIAELESENG